MPLDSIFTVENSDLQRLSPDEAVALFRELLWAEASSLGIGKDRISVPSAITVPDGGIDAEVRDADVTGGQGLIKAGLTRYQIKTGDFNISQPYYINQILFRNGTNELKLRVKSCIENYGTLAVVLFGWDKPETQDDQIVNKFKERLSEISEEYSGAKVEVWGQNNLRGFLQKYPSLALRVNRRGGSRFQTHWSWSSQDDMRKEFHAGPDQEAFIATVQQGLIESGDEAVHIRVLGDPGVGKTRLVLEATSTDELAPLVIYVDAPDKFRDSDLMSELTHEDNHFSAVLVIDECDPDSRSYIWNRLRHCGSRIKLVTIYNERDETSGTTVYADAPLLEDEQVAKIIEGYSIPPEQARRWAEICSGSPRVAHVIGQNLNNNPEDMLRPPDTVNVWDRYVVGRDDPTSWSTEQRRVTLRYIALFRRFGFGRPVSTEAELIAKMIQKADPSITWARFQDNIRSLRERRILQGETTLYITPKALHIKMWTDWWDTYGHGFVFGSFCEELNQSMLDWFFEMFKYAAESEAASRVVIDLLGPSGPFQGEVYLRSELGAGLFLALTEASPEKALACLKSTLGGWSLEEVRQFTTGRRQVIHALERMVVWRSLFQDAARLLLKLGEGENETWSNNASGIFASAFSVGTGPVAPTEASPEERFPVLQQALMSDSKDRRKLAMRACSAALSTGPHMRMVGSEYQGLRQEPDLWRPKTWGELFDAYRRVWNFLNERIDHLPEDEAGEAIDILLQHARGLTRIENLSHMVIETLTELADRQGVNRKQVLEAVVSILHYDGKRLPGEVLERWEKLRDDLTGTDYSSLMRRYVGTDLLEDRFDTEGNHVDQKQPQIEQLAQQSIANPDLLKLELEWLVTSEAADGHRFGYELGNRDEYFSLLPILIDSQRNTGKAPSLFFLGGYMRSLGEKDKTKFENLLDSLAEDDQGKYWIAELSWRSGNITDRSGERILSLAKKGVVDVDNFRMFIYGGVVRGLSLEVFQKWIEHLLDSSKPDGAAVGLELYHMFYRRGDPNQELHRDLTFRLLAHPTWFEDSDARGQRSRDDYDWSEIAKAFVLNHPEDSLQLADKMLEHYGERGTIVDGFHSHAQEVLRQIALVNPEGIWERVARFLGPPIDTRAFYLREWLRGDLFEGGGAGALGIIPPESIWKWVDEDADERAWYLASIVPNRLHREKGNVCLAREVLVRYGDREDVRRNFSANYFTEGWTGPESLHYEGKKGQLLSFKDAETNSNVIRWIDEFVQDLDSQIDHARIREEREYS